MLHHLVLYYTAVLYDTILYFTKLCYAVLYYAVLVLGLSLRRSYFFNVMRSTNLSEFPRKQVEVGQTPSTLNPKPHSPSTLNPTP